MGMGLRRFSLIHATSGHASRLACGKNCLPALISHCCLSRYLRGRSSSLSQGDLEAGEDLSSLLFLALNCTHLSAEQVATLLYTPLSASLDADVILDTLLLARKRWEGEDYNNFIMHLSLSPVSHAQLLAATRAAMQRAAGAKEEFAPMLLSPHDDVQRLFRDKMFAYQAAVRSIMTLPDFVEFIPPPDLIPLLHELLDKHLSGVVDSLCHRGILNEISVPDMLALMQRLAVAEGPAIVPQLPLPLQALSFSKEEVSSLIQSALEHNNLRLPAGLVQLPVMQQWSSAEILSLARQVTGFTGLERIMVPRLLEYLSKLPGFKQLDAAALVELLQSAVTAKGDIYTCGTLLKYIASSSDGVQEPAKKLHLVLEAAVECGDLKLLWCLAEQLYVSWPQELLLPFLEKVLACGNELATCKVLNKHGEGLSAQELQVLKDLAADKGMGVLELGLAYLLQLQEMNAVAEFPPLEWTC
jgi:hypothetical protein